ncbi:MAG: hypothetical protein ACKN9F_07340 [Methylomonas sp.]
MKKIDLIIQKHEVKIGDVCEYKKPNVTEDCVFYADDELVGFYLTKIPEKMCKLADLANAEFNSSNVPKSNMSRATVSNHEQYHLMKKGLTEKTRVDQFSCIIGSIAPKAQFKRNYGNRSSVHSVKSAQTFIKAMLMLAEESEQLIKEILPKQYEKQIELFRQVPDKWKFGNLFTSSISNYNISAPFHRDTGNIVGSVNVIICKKLNSKGGDLHIPDYNATIGQQNNSILVYPAWRNVHGVTPIIPTRKGGYRNSLVFYPLKAFIGLD